MSWKHSVEGLLLVACGAVPCRGYASLCCAGSRCFGSRCGTWHCLSFQYHPTGVAC